jgi:predicted DNA-binding protein (UPF0251 family)/DNA-directed RNA polymerase subunit RPC12/RpoP
MQMQLMPRRKRHRWVEKEPPVSVYKPAGIPAKDLDEILITVDEFEALRLADFQGLSQRDASIEMKISQPTFNRILAAARKKVAEGLVLGNVLRIEGGKYMLSDGSGGLECLECGERVEDPTSPGNVCPKCGSSHLRWFRWDTKKSSGD